MTPCLKSQTLRAKNLTGLAGGQQTTTHDIRTTPCDVVLNLHPC